MPTADLIFKNANVITVDSKQPVAEFVAVKDEKILFIGSKDRLNEFSAPGTRIIDCEGQTLVPGFNDAHCHIFSFVRKLTGIDLGSPEIKSIDDIKAVIKKKAENTPPGQWISGTDYNEFYLAEKRHPTRWEIDEVAPNHPVVLSHRSLHGCVLNSRALALAGITAEAPEPPGAMIGRRVEDGELNGFLVEMLGYIREKVMPPISAEELDKNIRLASAQYLSHGLTSLQDATFVNDFKRWQYYQHFKEQGLLKSRVYMMTGVEKVQEFQKVGLSFGSGDKHLRLGAVKIIPSLVSGRLYPSQVELNEMVLDAHRAGFQVACHAVQVGLLDAVIRTYEYLRESSPDFGVRRHRIEHCGECTPKMVQSIKRLQLTVITHPSYAYYNGDRYLATVSSDIIPFLYPLRSLVDSGIVMAGASDSPVAPNNPLMGIYGAITRLTSSGRKMEQKESITALQALALYTINAAYASHEEKTKGSITLGKLADMVLLSDDPTKVSPGTIKEIKVRMAVIGGKVAWEA